MPAHLTVPRVILALTVAVAAIDVALYGTALGQLASGPDAQGYDLLLWANRLASIVAVLAVSVVAVGAFVGGRILFPSLALLLSSGVVGGIALGLFALGTSLASYDASEQLGSLILAVRGTGQDLAPVPLFLAAGAAVLPFVGFLRVRRMSLASA